LAILCDTNVLLRAAQRHHPQYSVAAGAIERLIRANREPVIFLQNLVEFWNVATRPEKNNGLGWSVKGTNEELERLTESIGVLPEPARTGQLWRALVVDHEVRGVQVHDARLVAGMKAHGIREILTCNGGDFIRYAEISALSPDAV
jgi:predicted nucleic acid-binding protein